MSVRVVDVDSGCRFEYRHTNEYCVPPTLNVRLGRSGSRAGIFAISFAFKVVLVSAATTKVKTLTETSAYIEKPLGDGCPAATSVLGQAAN